MNFRGPRPKYGGGMERPPFANQGGWNPNFNSFEEPPFGGGEWPRPRFSGPRMPQWRGPSFSRLPQPGPTQPGIGEQMPGNFVITPPDVLRWLDHQHPDTLMRIYHHIQWLLDQCGIPPPGNRPIKPEEDTETWYEEDKELPEPHSEVLPNKLPLDFANSGSSVPPGGAKRPGLGLRTPNQPAGPRPSSSGPLQWTPGGWMPKDNSHKITTTMKPLPEPEVIPPNGSSYPDAQEDRKKLSMLKSNMNMMQMELSKTCRKFRISNLNQDDLSGYPEAQQERLQAVIKCVKAAEKTLLDFKDFLKTDKYKEWNDSQTEEHEKRIKAMIGETPQGVPHKRPSGPNQEDVEEKKSKVAEDNETLGDSDSDLKSNSAKSSKSPMKFQPGGTLSISK
ncbi:uncharacterized protein LOC131883735 isoform X2 [Tigriopus californicus]|nr:uncharacterized protein LOC131883735 isoform X2 [Tigriopus californicus]